MYVRTLSNRYRCVVGGWCGPWCYSKSNSGACARVTATTTRHSAAPTAASTSKLAHALTLQGLGAVGDTLTFVRDADPHLILVSVCRRLSLVVAQSLWLTMSTLDAQHIFMPLLIFESAFSVNWQILKRTLAQAVALAVPGTPHHLCACNSLWLDGLQPLSPPLPIAGLLISTALTALVAKFVFPYGWSWPASLVLGATLSATDPVAVVALLKELGVSPRLGTLIEGESLLNDGTAIVVFDVFLEMVLVRAFLCGAVQLCGSLAYCAVAVCRVTKLRRVASLALLRVCHWAVPCLVRQALLCVRPLLPLYAAHNVHLQALWLPGCRLLGWAAHTMTH